MCESGLFKKKNLSPSSFRSLHGSFGQNVDDLDSILIYITSFTSLLRFYHTYSYVTMCTNNFYTNTLQYYSIPRTKCLKCYNNVVFTHCKVYCASDEAAGIIILQMITVKISTRYQWGFYGIVTKFNIE